MRTQDYNILYKIEESYWWFVGMRRITRSILDAYYKDTDQLNLLDAGCGTGIMLSWLRAYSAHTPVVGIDFSSEALRFCKTRRQDFILRASITDLPLKSNHFDLVTCLDVICQLPADGSDRRALSELFRVLKPEGRLILRVPAYEWLRSGHDEALDTYHRYTVKELKEILQGAGFIVERATYANTLLFPLAIIARLGKRFGVGHTGSDVRPLSPGLAWLNKWLSRLLSLESKFLAASNGKMPFGLSAICLARKPFMAHT